MDGTPDTMVLIRGSMRTIEFARCANGDVPARQFIEDLDESDQRKLDVLFRRMADTGKIFNVEQFKQVDGRIYEFKRFKVRIGCFQIVNRWLLTHGFVKKQDRWPAAELEKAKRIMNEHLDREQRFSQDKGKRK